MDAPLSRSRETRFLPPRREHGNTLLVSMMVVAVLSLVVGAVLASVSARYNSAYRSTSWNDALLTAESGMDTTISELCRLLPDVQSSANGSLGAGYSEPPFGLINGLQFSPGGLLTNGTTLNVSPPTLTHTGEGGTSQQCSVKLEVVSLSDLLKGGATGAADAALGLLAGKDMQLIRLTSTGTVNLAGGTVAGPSRLDNELWRPSLVTDRSTGKAVVQPNVARTIQVILRPVHPFEGAVTSNGPLLAADPGTIFDSFNSALTTASTNGEYDSLKRLADGAVRANSPTVVLGGPVFGNISTSGGTLGAAAATGGTVNNADYTSLPSLTVPSSLLSGPLTPALSGSATLPAGTSAAPAVYQFNGISGNLHLTAGAPGTGTDATVYVNGDFTGGIEVDSGVTAKVYVSGSIITNASQLKNDGRRAANLQIYGVPTSAGAAPVIRLNADASLVASIYAPGHQVTINGSNDVSGAIVAGSFQATGALRVHYDEALALNTGPTLRYQVSNWVEITK